MGRRTHALPAAFARPLHPPRSDAHGTKGGAILDPGESVPGLGELLAKAHKTGNAQEADRLARAIRQRMHITEKTRR